MAPLEPWSMVGLGVAGVVVVVAAVVGALGVEVDVLCGVEVGVPCGVDVPVLEPLPVPVALLVAPAVC